jgi:hypothetical protein
LKKLFHHAKHIEMIKDGENCGPLHVSFWPTNRCQLTCHYCCFGKTKRNDAELSLEDFQLAIRVLEDYNLLVLEFSGGGEPLLWTHFNEAVDYCYDKWLGLSLVTNGLALKDIPQETLSRFNWIRVSIQSVEYAEKIAWDWIPFNVKKSMSYILYQPSQLGHVQKLYEYAKHNNIIIRVAPNRPCGDSWAKVVEDEVNKWGYPLLFFPKESGRPKGCYFAWIRGAVTWDGYFLVCPSPELSWDSAGRIDDKFKLCKIKDLEKWLKDNPPRNLGYDCSFCNCGKEVNDFLFDLINDKTEDVDFV